MKKQKRARLCSSCDKPGHTRRTCARAPKRPRACKWCFYSGHLSSQCAQRPPEAGSAAAALAKPIVNTKTTPAKLSSYVLVSGKRVPMHKLKQEGTLLMGAAYEPETKTLEVVYRGRFIAHRYRFTKVPRTVARELLDVSKPSTFIDMTIRTNYPEQYVVARKPK